MHPCVPSGYGYEFFVTARFPPIASQHPMHALIIQFPNAKCASSRALASSGSAVTESANDKAKACAEE